MQSLPLAECGASSRLPLPSDFWSQHLLWPVWPPGVSQVLDQQYLWEGSLGGCPPTRLGTSTHPYTWGLLHTPIPCLSWTSSCAAPPPWLGLRVLVTQL